MDDFETWLTGLGDIDELFPTYGKKRFQPDPSGKEKGPPEEGYIRGVPEGLGQNRVAPIWLNYGRTASESIDRGAAAERQGVTAGAVGARQEFERQLLSSYQSGGANPLVVKRLLAESRPLVGQEIHGALASVESNRLREQRGLLGGVSSAIAQSYLGERNLIAALNQASLARKTARGAGQLGWLSSATGAIGTAIGSYYGGAIGGKIGGEAGTNIGQGIEDEAR